jgi:hypothetical protein
MRGRYARFPKWEDTNETFERDTFRDVETPKASMSERGSCCTTCFQLNPQHLPEKDTGLILYSTLQESAKSGCRFCLLIHRTLSYYLQYRKSECFDPGDIFEMVIQTGEPILLATYFVRPYFPSIMLYAPPGMLRVRSVVSPGQGIPLFHDY